MINYCNCGVLIGIHRPGCYVLWSSGPPKKKRKSRKKGRPK